MRSNILCAILAVAGLAATPALAQPGATPQKCFFSSEFESWKAADPSTIYIRVRLHHYYRLDLAAPCPGITWPGAFLITKLHGSDSMCSALDWDLHVAQSWHDIPVACIVKKMTPLTDAEAAAIPAKAKP